MSDINLMDTTDAKVWADEFVRIKNKAGWQLEDIDEALMVGWFANMWAATYDPLQSIIEHQQKEIKTLREALESIKSCE